MRVAIWFLGFKNPHKCSFCSQFFFKNFSRRVHESSCPDRTAEIDEKKDDIEMCLMDLPYFCEDCKIIFGTEVLKVAHDNKIHKGSSSKFYVAKKKYQSRI